VDPPSEIKDTPQEGGEQPESPEFRIPKKPKPWEKEEWRPQMPSYFKEHVEQLAEKSILSPAIFAAYFDTMKIYEDINFDKGLLQNQYFFTTGSNPREDIPFANVLISDFNIFKRALIRLGEKVKHGNRIIGFDLDVVSGLGPYDRWSEQDKARLGYTPVLQNAESFPVLLKLAVPDCYTIVVHFAAFPRKNENNEIKLFPEWYKIFANSTVAVVFHHEGNMYKPWMNAFGTALSWHTECSWSDLFAQNFKIFPPRQGPAPPDMYSGPPNFRDLADWLKNRNKEARMAAKKLLHTPNQRTGTWFLRSPEEFRALVGWDQVIRYIAVDALDLVYISFCLSKWDRTPIGTFRHPVRNWMYLQKDAVWLKSASFGKKGSSERSMQIFSAAKPSLFKIAQFHIQKATGWLGKRDVENDIKFIARTLSFTEVYFRKLFVELHKLTNLIGATYFPEIQYNLIQVYIGFALPTVLFQDAPDWRKQILHRSQSQPSHQSATGSNLRGQKTQQSRYQNQNRFSRATTGQGFYSDAVKRGQPPRPQRPAFPLPKPAGQPTPLMNIITTMSGAMPPPPAQMDIPSNSQDIQSQQPAALASADTPSSSAGVPQSAGATLSTAAKTSSSAAQLASVAAVLAENARAASSPSESSSRDDQQPRRNGGRGRPNILARQTRSPIHRRFNGDGARNRQDWTSEHYEIYLMGRDDMFREMLALRSPNPPPHPYPFHRGHAPRTSFQQPRRPWRSQRNYYNNRGRGRGRGSFHTPRMSREQFEQEMSQYPDESANAAMDYNPSYTY